MELTLDAAGGSPEEGRPAEVQDRSTKRPTDRELRLERNFALAVAVVPFLGVVAAAIWHAITWVDLGILIATYTVTGLGITVGYHRLFTHQSFTCPRWLEGAFAIAGSMAVQGPVIRWVADHRRHHQFSDKDGDPHSPNLGGRSMLGLWHSHMGWFFSEQKTRIRRFVPDLITNRMLSWIDQRYLWWVVASLALPAALGGLVTWSLEGALTAVLWGGLVRIFLIHHVTWSINSICHVSGARPFHSRDLSTNNLWLAIPSFGESWHNAHHAFPTSAVHGVGRWQLDLSAMLIGGLEAVGLARNVRRPTAEQIEKRRV